MTDNPPDTFAAYWSRVGAEWQQLRPQRLWRRCSDAVHLPLLQEWLPPAASVGRLLKTDLFEEACGGALMQSILMGAGRVYGIDLAASTGRQARMSYRCLAVAVADVRRLPFAKRRFDTVVSLSTLDHFGSPADLDSSLAEIHRVLRPGGTLIVTLDNAANPVVALRNRLGHRRLRRIGVSPYHCGPTLTAASLRRMLTAHGLRPIAMTTLMHCPRILAVGLAGIMETRGTERLHRRFIALTTACERLAALPTRQMTGYFVAAKALREP